MTTISKPVDFDGDNERLVEALLGAQRMVSAIFEQGENYEGECDEACKKVDDLRARVLSRMGRGISDEEASRLYDYIWNYVSDMLKVGWVMEDIEDAIKGGIEEWRKAHD